MSWFKEETFAAMGFSLRRVSHFRDVTIYVKLVGQIQKVFSNYNLGTEGNRLRNFSWLSSELGIF